MKPNTEALRLFAQLEHHADEQRQQTDIAFVDAATPLGFTIRVQAIDGQRYNWWWLFDTCCPTCGALRRLQDTAYLASREGLLWLLTHGIPPGATGVLVNLQETGA